MSFLVCTRANPSQLKQLHFMPYFLSTLFKSFLNDVLFKAEIICSSVYHILFVTTQHPYKKLLVNKP